MNANYKAMDNKYDEELGELKESLKMSLRIIRKAIVNDNKILEEHYEEYGDLYVRIEDGMEGETPRKTEVIREPIAGKFRLEIKSMLECIALIDQKLGGIKGSAPSRSPDGAEGEELEGRGGKIDPRKWGNKTREKNEE